MTPTPAAAQELTEEDLGNERFKHLMQVGRGEIWRCAPSATALSSPLDRMIIAHES
jgi:hypothetical protein